MFFSFFPQNMTWSWVNQAVIVTDLNCPALWTVVQRPFCILTTGMLTEHAGFQLFVFGGPSLWDTSWQWELIPVKPTADKRHTALLQCTVTGIWCRPIHCATLTKHLLRHTISWLQLNSDPLSVISTQIILSLWRWCSCSEPRNACFLEHGHYHHWHATCSGGAAVARWKPAWKTNTLLQHLLYLHSRFCDQTKENGSCSLLVSCL